MAEVPQKDKQVIDQNSPNVSVTGDNPDIIKPESYLENQHWMLRRMRKAGYLKQNDGDASEGVCFGIGLMGGAALLVDELDRFSERLIKINDIPSNRIAKRIAEARAKEKEVYQETQEELYGARKQLNASEIKALWKQMELKEEYDPDFKAARIIQEIPAFFNGVEIYQQIWRYPELFTNQILQIGDANPAIPILQSPKLEKLGGMKNLGCFSGLYNKDELISYFKSLHAELSKEPPLKHPVIFSLNTANHSITVGFDSKSKNWIFINANKLPPFEINAHENEEEIADAVIDALFGSNDITFYTEIYTTANQSTEVARRIQAWKITPEFQKLHYPAEDKVNRIDSNGGTWLFLAARKGNIDEVNRLLAAKADPNLAITYIKKFKINPLSAARRNGHIKVIKALLSAGADPDGLVDEQGLTPLYYAATEGQLEITKALLSKGANPEIKDKYGTPLMYAVYENKLEMVKVLLEGGASPDSVNKETGESIIKIATDNGNKKIIQALKQKTHTETTNVKGLQLCGLFKPESNKQRVSPAPQMNYIDPALKQR